MTGDSRYSDAADSIKAALMRTAYDPVNKRFVQGVSSDGLDGAWAIDCCTWAGKQSISIAGIQIAKDCAATAYNEFFVTGKTILNSTNKEHYNTTYKIDTPVDGFKPYSNRDGGYNGAPEIVWTEGTLGYCALQAALGNWSEVSRLLEEVIKIQNCTNSTGGVLYVTETHSSLPWEFHVWESVVSSAWLYLVVKCPETLFPIIQPRPSENGSDII